MIKLGQSKVDLGKTPRAREQELSAEFDVRQILANWAGLDLTRINGLGLAAVMKILSEIRPDLSRFANVKSAILFVAGRVPGHEDQRGQVLSSKTKRGTRVRQALMIGGAMSLSAQR